MAKKSKKLMQSGVVVARFSDGAFRKTIEQQHDKFHDRYPDGASVRAFIGDKAVFGNLQDNGDGVYPLFVALA